MAHALRVGASLTVAPVVIKRSLIDELTSHGTRNDIVAAIVRDIMQEVLTTHFTIGAQQGGGAFAPAQPAFQEVLDRYWRPVLSDAIFNILVYGFYVIRFERPKMRPVGTTDPVPVVVDISQFDLYIEIDTQTALRTYTAEMREGMTPQHLFPFVVHHPSMQGEPQSPTARSIRHLRLLGELLDNILDADYQRTHPAIMLVEGAHAVQATTATEAQLMARTHQTADFAYGRAPQEIVQLSGHVLGELITGDERARQHGQVTFAPHMRNPPAGYTEMTGVITVPAPYTVGTPARAEPLPNYQQMIHLLAAHICSIFGVPADTVLQAESMQRFASSASLVRSKTRRLVSEFQEILVNHTRIMYSLIYDTQDAEDAPPDTDTDTDTDTDAEKHADTDASSTSTSTTTAARSSKKRKKPFNAHHPHALVAVPHFTIPPLVDVAELRQIWLDGIIKQETYGTYALQALHLPRELAAGMPGTPDVPDIVREKPAPDQSILPKSTDGGTGTAT